jgi:hypothetical protein
VLLDGDGVVVDLAWGVPGLATWVPRGPCDAAPAARP